MFKILLDLADLCDSFGDFYISSKCGGFFVGGYSRVQYGFDFAD